MDVDPPAPDAPVGVPLVPLPAVPLPPILLPPRRKVVADERELVEAVATAEPGDDILLRGGRYRGTALFVTQSGRPDAPIGLRSAPGEWAILDGAGAREDHAVLEVGDGEDRSLGAHWIFEQLEITDSTEPRGDRRRAAANLYGTAAALRHLVVHDTAQVGNWHHTGPNECHGLLVFNCGAGNREHSMYVTNDAARGTKRITHCILLNAASYNLHAFHDHDPVGGLLVESCVASGAGALRGRDVSRDNFFFAVETGSPERLRDITLSRTYQWTAAGRSDGVSFAEYGDPDGHRRLTLVDNVWQLDEPLDTTRFESVEGRGGEIAVRPDLVRDGIHYERDPLEDGRGIVVVFNANGRERSLTIDLHRLGIGAGEPYGVWDAADWGPEPAVSGISVGTATIPMDGSVRRPVGGSAPPSTLPEFGVFVVRRARRWVA